MLFAFPSLSFPNCVQKKSSLFLSLSDISTVFTLSIHSSTNSILIPSYGMKPLNTADSQAGDYAPLRSTTSIAPRSRRKGLNLQKIKNTRSSQDGSDCSPVSSHSSASSTHSRSSTIHRHFTDSPTRSLASSNGSPTQRLYSENAKSPLLRTPGILNHHGPQRSYSQSPRYYSLKQCSLTAILVTTLIAATILPHFLSGSDAALNESGGANVLNHAAGMGKTVSGASLGGQWDLIGHSGVSAMHAVLRPFSDSILFLERVQASTYARMQGTSENGNKGEHFAWSTEFSANNGQWRALDVKSNMFCSAGGYLPDGVSPLFSIFYMSSRHVRKN